MSSNKVSMDEVVALAKRRGFIYQSSDIYGGLANVYDYGPMGAELLRNIRDAWWKHFIQQKEDVVGIESMILMHPDVWKASGHVDGFSEPQVDCKSCQNRFRTDHLIADNMKDVDPDDYDYEGLDKLIKKHKIKCPVCGKFDWTKSRDFNLLMETSIGVLEGGKKKVYLRGETAQGMYVQFKNVLDTTRQKVPFGIAQVGKAFRNEITKGKYIFRTLEFEQMELQYFIREEAWKKEFEVWRREIEQWYTKVLAIDKKKFSWKPHHPDKLAHYAKKAEDYYYNFPWGGDEVSGLHYRTDFDLSTHQKHSGAKLTVLDNESGEVYTPHVVESTYGLNRNLLMVLIDAYNKESDRVVMKFSPVVAPYKVAVFPLLANKPELVKKAKELFDRLKIKYHTAWDARGNIGKRYAAQDEIGTPFCITIDFDTLEDDAVTIRDRDTTKQERVSVDKIGDYLQNKL
jgi:glycyl-tRNA synthetase